jgi:hypothetical protein
MLAFAIIAVSPATADTIIDTSDQGSVTFAQYDQVNGATQQWAISTSGGTTTITASGSVEFSFSGAGLPFQGPELAAFTLTASSTQIGSCGASCGAGDSFDQFGYTGTFSFTDEGLDPGANLLSGTFEVTGSPSTTGAQLNSNIGSSGGGFDASATAGNLNQLVLTSTFLNFTNQTEEDASFSLSSLNPVFGVGTVTAGQAYPLAGPFDASGAGTFASNPGPTEVTPEPSTSVLIGGGLLSLGLLRRRRLIRQ